jgi:predicted ferric reductase
MQTVGPGVPVRIQGAFGSFLAERSCAPQLWVAGGVGITPFVARLRDRPLDRQTRLLYLYRTEEDAAFLPEIRAIAATNPQLSFRGVATGDGVPDLDLILPDAEALAEHECYLCGPPAMVASVEAALQQRGITPRYLHLENFEFR